MIESMKTLLSMSISGGIMVLALMILKPFLKEKLSKSWQYYIWLLVLLRLLLPFSAEGSMMNVFFAEPQKSVQQFETVGQVPDLEVVQPTVTAPMVPTEPSVLVEKPTNPNNNTIPLETVPVTKPQEVEPKIDWTAWIQKIVSNIWLLWVVIAVSLFVRKVYIYQRFVRHIRKSWQPVEAIELLDHVAVLAERIGVRQAVELCVSGSISTPMLIGFWKPCILLPKARISPSDFDFTVLHELTHYKRRDMLYKWLVQLTLCLHWFNPMVYLMEKEISRCCELSCDEMVIKHLDRSGKQAYGDTLINAAGKKDLGSELASVTLSESGELLKERLLAILNYRKMSKRLIALALALTLLLSACGTVLGAYVKREEVEESTVEEMPEMPTEIPQEYPAEQEKETDNKTYLDYLRRSGWLWRDFNVDEGIDWQSYGDWNWFGFIADHEMDYVVDEDGFVWCKQEEIEKALEEHLDIDVAQLRMQTDYYDAQKKMYRIPEGWDPGLVSYTLLDSWQEDNLLYIESTLYDATRKDAVMGTALTTIRMEGDGWKILSNTFPYKTAEELFRERVSFENFRFYSEEPGVTEIVLDGIQSYYEQFMGETVPESMRIDSLEISNLKEVGFGKNENLYRADIAYHTSSPYWYTGVGVPREDGSYDCLIESQGFRFKSLNDGNHIITDIGQGGMMDGLYPLDENEDPIYDKIDISLYQNDTLQQTVSVTDKRQMRRLLENTLYIDDTGELRGASDFEQMHEYVVVDIDGYEPFYFFADKGRELSYGDGTTVLYPSSNHYYHESGDSCYQIASGTFMEVYELTDGESNYRMNLESNSNVDLNFHNIDFIPEFSEHNLGSIHYLEAENQLWVSVLRHIGTSTGAPSGPVLTYTVDFDDNSVVSREYRGVVNDGMLTISNPDDGSMETMSDERLVEVAKQLHTLMKSYRLPLITENLRDENSLSKYNITMTVADDRLISHGTYVMQDESRILDICSVAETQKSLLVQPDQLFNVIEQTECTFGKWSGQSYHIRWFTEQGGMSGYQHEYHYFLTDGTYWVYAAGYPLYGNGGIETQAERFEQCLSTLEVTPPQPVLENPIDADRLKELPVVTAPDENGYFPQISETLWRQYIVHSEEAAVMPTEEITPFMENEKCREILSSLYAGSDKMEVLYEYRGYTLAEDEYDPYNYMYRDQYMPTWVVVLKVDNIAVYDRVVIALRKGYWVSSSSETNSKVPKELWEVTHASGWEADWNLGDCSGLVPVFSNTANWSPSLWFPEEMRGLLLDNDGYDVESALPVSKTNSMISCMYSFTNLSEYVEPVSGRENDLLISCYEGVALYSYKDKSLHVFDHVDGGLAFLDNSRILQLGNNGAALYDLSREDAASPVFSTKNLGENLILADSFGNDWAAERYALLYCNEENLWNVLVIDHDGAVLHHAETALSNVPAESDGYRQENISDIQLDDGRVSFVYYPKGRNHSQWQQYEMDLNVGDELTLMNR